MKRGLIRSLALGVFRQGDRILVAEGYDPVKDQYFYRPPGGGIEFGERGEDALRREMREELAAEVVNPRYLGMLENIFTFNGVPGHEIVLLYAATFAHPAFYARETIAAQEDDGSPFTVVWKPLADFAAGPAPLYPDGLLALLTGGESP